MKKGKQIPELERQPSTTSAKLKRKGQKARGPRKKQVKVVGKGRSRLRRLEQRGAKEK